MFEQKKFANELRSVMAKKHISQATLARLTSLDSGTISRLLTGNRQISYDTVAKVANKLDMWKGLTPYQLSNKVEELQVKFNYVSNENKLIKVVNFIMLITIIILLII